MGSVSLQVAENRLFFGACRGGGGEHFADAFDRYAFLAVAKRATVREQVGCGAFQNFVNDF